MNKYFIVGYYGNSNFGDEVMLEALIDKLGKNNQYIITSGNNPIGYKNVEYFFMHTILSDIKKMKLLRFLTVFKELNLIIKSIDIIYIGGGTLIKNNFSSNIIFLVISILSRIYNKKVNFISVGMEKLNFVNRFLYKVIFSFSHQIEVRDKFTLSKIGKSSFIEDLAIQKFKTIREKKRLKKLIIAPALFPHENLLEKSNQYIEFLKNKDEIILISSHSLSKHSDLQLCEAISKKIKCEVFKFKNFKSIENFLYYGEIISERYHIGILSCFLNSKLILVGDSSKLKTLSSELKVSIYMTIDDIVLDFKKPNIKGIV